VSREQRLQHGAGQCTNPLLRDARVVESWNRANSVIFFGKGGGIAANRDEQELSVLCLPVCRPR
jgi:hypothetical protein